MSTDAPDLVATTLVPELEALAESANQAHRQCRQAMVSAVEHAVRAGELAAALYESPR